MIILAVEWFEVEGGSSFFSCNGKTASSAFIAKANASSFNSVAGKIYGVAELTAVLTF